MSSSADLQSVIQKVGELPAMPAVVSDVLRLTEDPKVEMGKVGKVIEGDPAMTAKILKVSNSSYYGMKKFVGTLKLWQWIEAGRGVHGHAQEKAARVDSHKLTNRQQEQRLRDHFISPRRVREWRDIQSQLHTVVAEQGWRVANVDSVVVAERPRLGPHIETMRAAIASRMGLTPQQVGVKATTNERLGPTGREEGIACHAVALLVQP